MRWARRLAVLAFVLLILTWGSGAQEPKLEPGSPCQNPTVTVGPDQDLQKVIDEVPTGAVLLLLPGTYTADTADLVIAKSLALCGSGSERTILQGTTINIKASDLYKTGALQITLEGFTITGAKAYYGTVGGIWFESLTQQPSEITLRDVRIIDNEGIGMKVKGPAAITLQDVLIAENSDGGIFLMDHVSVIAKNIQVLKNGERFPQIVAGMGISCGSRLVLHNALIAGNKGTGLGIGNVREVTILRARVLENSGSGGDPDPLCILPTSVSIAESLISGNGHIGISATAGEKGNLSVSIRQTEISRSGFYGIWMNTFPGGSTTIQASEVAILGNGTIPQCKERGPEDWSSFAYICNGITVMDKGVQRLILADSVVRGNTDWGIAAVLKKCGYYYNNFSGKVIFEGANVIEGNNTAGNHQGEVCLP